MALTTQSMVEIAKSTNAAALANSEAVAQFRASIDASVKLPFTFPREVKRAVEEQVHPIQLIWTEGKAPCHDHPVLYCLREVHRILLLRVFNVYTTNLKTCVVGSSHREISKYSSNPSICFQVNYSEPKDLSRFALKAAEQITSALLSKVKRNKHIRQDPDKVTEPSKLKRFKHYKELMKDLNTLAGGMRIFPEPVKCNVLIFEDSAYNYGEKEWLEIFERTGAQVAYGYGIFPLELLFEDFPGHEALLVECESESFQTPKNFVNGLLKWTTKQDFTFDLYGGFGLEEDIPDCHVCNETSPDLGEQILQCEYKGVTKHAFSLTDSELSELKTSLRVEAGSPFEKVMDEARKNLPNSGFSYECEVVYVSAGPGCGKSFYVRTIAETGALILSPFVKLAGDYSDKTAGGTNKWNFKTQHRALETVGHETIFVDEFTSYDYRLLAFGLTGSYVLNNMLEYFPKKEVEKATEKSYEEFLPIGASTEKSIKVEESQTESSEDALEKALIESDSGSSGRILVARRTKVGTRAAGVAVPPGGLPSKTPYPSGVPSSQRRPRPQHLTAKDSQIVFIAHSPVWKRPPLISIEPSGLLATIFMDTSPSSR
ncbi:hypothetical protein GE061_000266 [Apolygus lucorum]|uniref:(+)RNA virus helicase C-terminal domain-containing protein n=1 Tax=Apolygus lucorum TaxID=248454 RepID=A0A8S9Y5B8_APOLU|nr:hypothetical protein GE061_000266 [Apolygus lucorum]